MRVGGRMGTEGWMVNEEWWKGTEEVRVGGRMGTEGWMITEGVCVCNMENIWKLIEYEILCYSNDI